MNWSKSLVSLMVLSCAAISAQAQVVGIATNAAGTSFYAVGAAIANVMQQKANVSTRVQPSSGPSVFTPLLNRGEVEFAILTSLDASNSYLGLKNFSRGKNSDVRIVGVVFVIPIGIAVANDSPVKSIKDLKGLRMPSQFTAQVIVDMIQNAMLAVDGLSGDDLKPFPVANFVVGMRALGEGKVDAATFCIGCGVTQQVNAALASHGGVRFLSLPDTPATLAALHKTYPGSYLKLLQPAPALAGIVGPTHVMAYSGFLMTNAKVPDDVVYKATKAIHDNKPMLEAATQYMKTFEPDRMTEESAVPYHPGAEKFYKEVRQWPPNKH